MSGLRKIPGEVIHTAQTYRDYMAYEPLELQDFIRIHESDLDELLSVLRECLADYSHPRFTDRLGQADHIRKVLPESNLPTE